MPAWRILTKLLCDKELVFYPRDIRVLINLRFSLSRIPDPEAQLDARVAGYKLTSISK